MGKTRSFIWWSAVGSASATLLLWWILINARLRLPGSLWELVVVLLVPCTGLATMVLSLIALVKPAGPRGRLLLVAALTGIATLAGLTTAAVWNVRGPQPSTSFASSDLEGKSASPDGRFVVRIYDFDLGAMAPLSFPITVASSANGSPQYEVDDVSADDLRPRNDPTGDADFGVSWENGPKGPIFFVGPHRYEIDGWPPSRAWWDLSQ